MYDGILEFVKNAIASNGRFSQPFRDRYKHSLRVKKWAERMQETEGGDLEVIQMAALFHDVGWDEDKPHAHVGAEITEKYLGDHGYDKGFIMKVVEAVANHNNRIHSDDNLSIESLIIMDADLIDELGAVRVIWESMAVAFEDEPDYYKAYNRICDNFQRTAERNNLVQTKTGRKLYEGRLEIIDWFLGKLRFELDIR